MISLSVELGARSYAIRIGNGLLDDVDMLRTTVKARQVMLLSNETVAPLYLDKLERAYSDRSLESVILADGEQYKTLESFERIITVLLDHGFDRSCALIALGGGVVGDIAGFAAACYQRGVDFVQFPTTLLAQVDSSVGGKTAVNHPRGKNMIGAFHQPVAVITDTGTLRSLPAREMRAGLAEIIKYGLIFDREFFAWLEENAQAVLDLHDDPLAYAIRRSCELKAKIVAQDETEAGVRALLNLGHSFGHGLENILGYGSWLHGEAVACGMCLAVEMSVALGTLEPENAERARLLIKRSGLPTSIPANVDAQQLIAAMRLDKKNRDGRIRLILLRALGDAFICADYDEDILRAVIERNSQPR